MSDKSSFFTKYPRLALILVNLFVVVLILGLIEIGLRVFTPDWLQQKMALVNKEKEQDFAGTDRSWKTIKDANGHVVSFEAYSTLNVAHSEYQNKVTMDKYGGRSYNSRDTGELVLFFGDSFTFGLGVDSQETFISLWQNEYPQFKFLNLGIPGSGLFDQYHAFEYRINQNEQFDKAVFCFFEGNDLNDILRYAYKFNTDGAKKVKETSPDQKKSGLLKKLNKQIVHNPFMARLYIVQYTKQKMMNLLNKSADQKHMIPIYKINAEIAANPQKKEEFKQHLKRAMLKIDSLAALNNVDFTYVLIPDKAQMLKEETQNMLAYYGLDSTDFDPFVTTSIFSEVALELKTNFADVKNEMMQIPNKKELYYVADNHFTPKGHKEFASLMKDHIGDFLIQKDSSEQNTQSADSISIID